VERSGQGYDRILESCIWGAKPRPRFEGTDNFQVFLTLEGQVQDTRFLRLLEAIGQERMQSFDTDHLLLLDLAYRQRPIPAAMHPFLSPLMDSGILEKVGRKIIPSRRLMSLLGKVGKYTRLKGLDRPAQRALLLQHIQESEHGAKFEDLHQVLPGIPERMVKELLQSMKAKGLIHTQGKTKAARWMSGPASNPLSGPT
jgi:ATP-dependent DNA helicase RecG